MPKKQVKAKKKLSKAAKLSRPSLPQPPNDMFFQLHFQEIIDAMLSKYVVWSPLEAAWLRMKDEASKVPRTTLNQGLENMVRKSFGGCFIKRMNEPEDTTYEVVEKKMELTEFILKHNDRPIVNSRLNDFTEDIQKYLSKTVKDSYPKNGRISRKMLLRNLPTLKLCYQKITNMDTCLQGLTNLLALILTANYIKDFHGKALPANLNMLELYGNVMQDIEKLCVDSPSLILYLGVGRNYLWRASSLKRLTGFEYLHLLDLSENDFSDIMDVLDKLVGLTALRSLYLEGNPCSVPVSYVHIVQRFCPQIEFIDGIKFAKDCPPEPEKDDYRGILQFHGLRFFHVPRPSEAASRESKPKTNGFYQLEFEIPLLDPSLQNYESRSLEMTMKGENEKEEAPHVIKDICPFEVNYRKRRSRAVTQTSMQRDSEFVDKVKKSYLRYLQKDKEWPVMTSFMSSKVHHWSKVIHFHSPCIEIPVSSEMWRQLRDTMRSIVTIRLYYKEVSYVSKSRRTTKSHSSRRASRRGSRRASRRVSRRGSRRASRRASKRSSTKSSANAHKKSLHRKSTKRHSMKSNEKENDKRKQSGRRKSSKRRLTKGARAKHTLKTRKSDVKMEEVLLVRNLIAKIPVPVEIPKWNVPYVGYTWDIRERCLARRYPNLQNVKYSKTSLRGLNDERSRRSKTAASKKKSRSSVAKRKSKATEGRRSKVSRKSKMSRKSKVSRKSHASEGKRKSKAHNKRQSMKSRQSGVSKRKSEVKRKSRISKAKNRTSVLRKQQRASGSRGAKSSHGYPIPDILTCHVGVGLKRVGKVATESFKSHTKHRMSKHSRKSKSTRKQRQSRKSKSSSKKFGKSLAKRQSAKRTSKFGRKK